MLRYRIRGRGWMARSAVAAGMDAVVSAATAGAGTGERGLVSRTLMRAVETYLPIYACMLRRIPVVSRQRERCDRCAPYSAWLCLRSCGMGYGCRAVQLRGAYTYMGVLVDRQCFP